MTDWVEYRFSSLPSWVKHGEAFAPDCRLRLTPEAEKAGQSGALALLLLRHGGPVPIGDVQVAVGATRGRFTVTMAGSGTKVNVGADCAGNFTLKLWKNSRVSIGAGTTANDVKVVLSDGEITIGQDCMFSDEVLIQGADQHGLIDPVTLAVLNNFRRKIKIDDHVWLGRRCLIMPDVRVGFGAVVGAGAVVTADVPALSVAVGVPARVVREGTTWSRSPKGATEAESAMIRAFQDGAAQT